MKSSKLTALCAIAALSATTLIAAPAQAADLEIQGLKILKLRSVGNFSNDTYDNIVEVWFTTPLTFSSTVSCRETSRVIIDAKYKHLIARPMQLSPGARPSPSMWTTPCPNVSEAARSRISTSSARQAVRRQRDASASRFSFRAR